MKRRTVIQSVAAIAAVPTIAAAGEVEMPARQKQKAINVVFDGPPGPVAGRFIEVETDDGRGIHVGEWIRRPDGLWALRFMVVDET